MKLCDLLGRRWNTDPSRLSAREGEKLLELEEKLPERERKAALAAKAECCGGPGGPAPCGRGEAAP